RRPRRVRRVLAGRRRRGRRRGGGCRHRQLAVIRSPSPGFTLVELLVVVALVGLASAAVVLTVPGGEAVLHRQADEFGLRLRHARDEAILGGRMVQVGADAAGYRFSRRDLCHWQPLEATPFAPRAWRDGVQAVLPPRQARVGFCFDLTGADVL